MRYHAEDLFHTPLDQAQIDFENEGGETYICGNPPYKGTNWRTKEQTEELGRVLSRYTSDWKALDYVSGWFVRAAEYSRATKTFVSFVATNSICQGLQVSILWPIIFQHGQEISFAYTSFKWANLASQNAGVAVVIVGLTSTGASGKRIFEAGPDGAMKVRGATTINPYLLDAPNIFVKSAKAPIGFDSEITDGSGALDGGFLKLDENDRSIILSDQNGRFSKFVRPYVGSAEFIKGTLRWCLWVSDHEQSEALQNQFIANRVSLVKAYREEAGTRCSVPAFGGSDLG